MRLHHATRPTCCERTDFLSPSFTCLTYTSSFARYRQYLLGRSFKSASMLHSTTCLLPPCYRNKRSYEHPCRSWCIRLLGCPANSSSWVGIGWGGSELLISGPCFSNTGMKSGLRLPPAPRRLSRNPLIQGNRKPSFDWRELRGFECRNSSRFYGQTTSRPLR